MHEKSFLKSFRIVSVTPCAEGSKKVRVLAVFDRDIGELLPYANAVLNRCMYDPVRNLLIVRCYGRPVILHANYVIIGQLSDPGLAEEILDALLDFLNRIAATKKEITPLYVAKFDPSWQRIYNILPKKNCRACREETCLAFALKLASGEQLPESCPELEQSQAEEIEAILEEIFRDPLLP